LNVVFFVAATLLLSVVTYAASVGFADKIRSGIVPVTLGSLFLSYVAICRLIAPKVKTPVKPAAEDDENSATFRIDVNKAAIYFSIPTVVGTATLISWPVVFGMLRVFDSVVANENAAESLLWEAIPAMLISGVILLVRNSNQSFLN
jgi:hypothetical protein